MHTRKPKNAHCRYPADAGRKGQPMIKERIAGFFAERKTLIRAEVERPAETSPSSAAGQALASEKPAGD